MRIKSVIGLLAVAVVLAAVLFVPNRSRHSFQNYDDVRREAFDQAGRSTTHRGQPPPRPAGLDTRLPTEKAAELRRLYPPTKESSTAFYERYGEIVESIGRELQAIDPKTDWFQLLTPGRRAVALIESLEAEVDNGGFDQFYLNSSGDGAALTPAALRLFGQEQVALMVERANAQFPGGPSTDRSERLVQMDKLGEQARRASSALDSEFYELKLPDEGLAGAATRYILNHQSEFFLSR